MASHVDIPRGAANFKVFADMVKNVPTEFFEMTHARRRQGDQLRLRVARSAWSA
jgi:hypothetical protein